jgi:beta-lactam-binding protein with PASTA domain
VNQDVALDLSAPGGGSRVGLAFAPAPAAAGAPAAATQTKIPDVVGYTAALARRKLTAAGFAISAATVVDAHGVVAQQMPEAGKVVASGSTVRLLFK